ncbi:MAG: CHAT domain-containing protein [Acidobacteriota bacterium]
MNETANVLFLVSDPLDASISIQRDLLALQDALRQLEAAATFHVRAAEADKVHEHLSLGSSLRYDVLHYLGHGYKAPDEADGVLIFEKDDGTADALDQIRLGIALKGAAAGFKLAVISACHSASVANALFAVGIDHVIVIDGDKPFTKSPPSRFAAGFINCC